VIKAVSKETGVLAAAAGNGTPVISLHARGTMAVIELNNGATVISREIEGKPHHSWTSRLIGRPLATADAPHQTIGKLIGLAVFASDALSSTAYATQELLVVLALASTAAFGLAMPLAIGIVALLTILTLSYEQTIHAYPGGGGAYIVARDNLGELPAQTAGAALLTDYILTVAVSISSGVAQITSAFPLLYPYRVHISVAMVLFVMLINLRGVKESGAVFALPSYFFLVMMFLTVGVGMLRYFTGGLGTVPNPPPLAVTGTQALTLFLILRAFSSGTTALTGVEAISNGITAFKEPRSKNAGLTLIWMSAILGTLLLGITFLSVKIGAIPSDQETVISQLARTVFNQTAVGYLLYLAVIGGTTVILIMAANTSFADFPRLAALHAGDGFLPKQFTYRGSRLVFSRGIVALALIASLLIILFQASVTALIPLYAIGVFLSFTLSQAGMAKRWYKCGHLKPGEQIKEPGSTLVYERNWVGKMIVNGFGSICTFVVMIVFASTKFRDGAWVIVLLTPLLVTGFFAIHHHYKDLARRLSLESADSAMPRVKRHRVILPIAGVHRGTMAALAYARSLSDDVTAVHVSLDEAEATKIRSRWDFWGDGVRLVVLDSPYRLMLEPLLDYIEEVSAKRQPNETLTIVVPQFVPRRAWHNLLHMQTALMLRMALLFKPGIIVIDVPYHVD
jgi:amino acid transporter